MKKRLAILLSPLLLYAVCGQAALLNRSASAQEGSQSPSEINRDAWGRVAVKFSRGQKINVGNRTTGPIVVIGWDHDFVEAFAVSDRGAEYVRARIESGASGSTVYLKADYADASDNDFNKSTPDELGRLVKRGRTVFDGVLEGIRGVAEGGVASTPRPPPAPPEKPPVDPKAGEAPRPAAEAQVVSQTRPGDIFFEVKVPRYADIESINVIRSEVLVSDVATPIVVDGARSIIRLGRVGAAEVRTQTGNVEIDSVKGLVDVVTTSGSILVRNANGDVRALSVSGKIDVECARGRVDVSNTDGPITLSGVTGDVSATATYSTVRVSGTLRADGRYYLKSMSGSISMEAPANSPGFTASLSSYRGGVESDFPLKSREPAATNTVNRRIIGRYGDGQAQITLDSFDGTVKLTKMAAGVSNQCK